MEQNYKPNSHSYKEAQATAAAVEKEKKIEKVVSGTVKTRKKSGFRKAMDNFVSDEVSSIKTYVVKDVIIPTIKKIISETVDTILFGKSKRVGGSSLGTHVSYRKYYDEPRSTRDAGVPTRHGYSCDEIILESRGEAERVLSQLNDLIETYEVVSVADLYDLVGIARNWTDNNYGWTNIKNAEVIRCRDGFLLQMPKVLPIK